MIVLTTAFREKETKTIQEKTLSEKNMFVNKVQSI